MSLFAIVALDTFSSRVRTLSHQTAVFGAGALGPVAGDWLLRKLRVHSSAREIARKLALWRGKEKIAVVAPGNFGDAEAATAELRELLAAHGTDEWKLVTRWTPAQSAKLPKTVIVALRRGETERQELADFIAQISDEGRRRFLGFFWSGDTGPAAEKSAQQPDAVAPRAAKAKA